MNYVPVGFTVAYSLHDIYRYTLRAWLLQVDCPLIGFRCIVCDRSFLRWVSCLVRVICIPSGPGNGGASIMGEMRGCVWRDAKWNAFVASCRRSVVWPFHQSSHQGDSRPSPIPLSTGCAASPNYSHFSVEAAAAAKTPLKIPQRCCRCSTIRFYPFFRLKNAFLCFVYGHVKKRKNVCTVLETVQRSLVFNPSN